MCSVNHHLKAIFIRSPKTGGQYIEEVLCRFYNFKRFYLERPDHYEFLGEYPPTPDARVVTKPSFLHLKKKGIFRYYHSSTYGHLKMNLSPRQWKEYFVFTFVRNPYDRFISAYKYIQAHTPKNSPEYSWTLEQYIDHREQVSHYAYFHMFLSQTEQMLNDNGQLDHLNAIGRFEHLEDDLWNILQRLGITEKRHTKAIEKNIRIHQSPDRRHFSVWYTPKILDFCNQWFADDFHSFSYSRCLSINDLKPTSFITRSVFLVILISLLVVLLWWFMKRRHS